MNNAVTLCVGVLQVGFTRWQRGWTFRWTTSPTLSPTSLLSTLRVRALQALGLATFQRTQLQRRYSAFAPCLLEVRQQTEAMISVSVIAIGLSLTMYFIPAYEWSVETCPLRVQMSALFLKPRLGGRCYLIPEGQAQRPEMTAVDSGQVEIRNSHACNH
jgi:hypothetical protein